MAKKAWQAEKVPYYAKGLLGLSALAIGKFAHVRNICLELVENLKGRNKGLGNDPRRPDAVDVLKQRMQSKNCFVKSWRIYFVTYLDWQNKAVKS